MNSTFRRSFLNQFTNTSSEFAREAVAQVMWHLSDAVLGDLHRRAGLPEIALQHRERALGSAPTDPVRELIRRRFSS